jgi:radical SAM protein with 4Fe4S-binding SPASM domain
MFVWWDGKVNPCDFDYKSVLSRWSLKDHTVSQIWTSEWYREMREKHLAQQRSQLDPCRRCIVT